MGSRPGQLEMRRGWVLRRRLELIDLAEKVQPRRRLELATAAVMICSWARWVGERGTASLRSGGALQLKSV
ncbi:hypothetical protein M0R45_035805 [Rubus argutus]|uniref:Uncharacterized protein n=1 Tax=Rubus argutus TaxID=59490 RepID=A0AAW1VVQ8_RUBAR